VISIRPEAPGIEVARSRGLPAVVLPSKGVPRAEYDRRLVAELQQRGVDLVCLAGFMRLLTAEFCRAFPLRALNIHPSLLPSFPGINAQKQALEDGVKISGCTVHFVDEQLDAGPIVWQAAVPVLDDDTEDTLAARILAEEHRIYSQAIALVLSERWRIAGRRVIKLDV
jgi:phosphoribosylglycinamide formyltransferase 1